MSIQQLRDFVPTLRGLTSWDRVRAARTMVAQCDLPPGIGVREILNPELCDQLSGTPEPQEP
jgi:hypothetical protein